MPLLPVVGAALHGLPATALRGTACPRGGEARARSPVTAWPLWPLQPRASSWQTATLSPGSPGLLTCSASKREGELSVAQGRVKDLESLFHRSEVELAAALSDKRSLESDAAELRAQLAKVGPAPGAGAPREA